MNRRGFLRFAAVAPVMAPVIAPALAAQAGAVSAGERVQLLSTIKWGSSIGDESWWRILAEMRRSRRPPLSMAESVNESVQSMLNVADRAASIGSRAETAVTKLTDFAITCVNRAAKPDAVVEHQMAEDDLFEPAKIDPVVGETV